MTNPAQRDVIPLSPTNERLADEARDRLEALVRVDSQSDESSDTIPSTAGQRELADQVAAFFDGLGLRVERDAHANVIARVPGRGERADQPPVALMAHLDTSRGTQAVEQLNCLEAWDGHAVPFPGALELQVDVVVYPQTARYVGHDLLYGPGRAPFGLDNKLGLTYLMELARPLEAQPEILHPPLLLVARPDEEIGRMAAVAGLAEMLAAAGVRYGYTVDGLLPFEINIENFNAAQATLQFGHRPPDGGPNPASAQAVRVEIGGVNTHGATAKAEGYRAATRLAAEVLAQLIADGHAPQALYPLTFASDPARDCDGVALFLAADDDARRALEATVEATVEPHVVRGASWSVARADEAPAQPSGAAWDVLRFVDRLFGSQPGFVLAAEDSEGREGYSNPYRIRPEREGLAVDVRLRDFEAEGLRDRERHIRQLGQAAGAEVEIEQQYVNMGPRVAEHEALVTWPRQAAEAVGEEARVLPIRGGTGVDPFLDHGIPIANLGTGYFAPESEKEFTSRQMMARHLRWLGALVQRLGTDV